jgi:hypothetical protein
VDLSGVDLGPLIDSSDPILPGPSEDGGSIGALGIF